MDDLQSESLGADPAEPPMLGYTGHGPTGVAFGTYKWGPSSTVGSTGGVVTWSLVGAGLGSATSVFTGTTVDIGSRGGFDHVAMIRAALQAWSDVANIRFVQVEDAGSNMGVGMMADIRIGMATGMRPGVAGFGDFPAYQGNGGRFPASGDVVLDANLSSSLAGFYVVALHELGHAIGLGHETAVSAIMNPSASSQLFGTGPFGTALQPDDIAGMRALYGAGPFSGALSYDMPTGQGPMTLIEAVAGLRVVGNAVGNAIRGTQAAENFQGGAGDDTLVGLGGADTLQGDAGYDVADYRASPDGVSVSLASGNGWSGDATGDVLATIESLIGSAVADVLIGSDDHNIIEGGFGGDAIEGRGGNDWVSYEFAAAAIAVNIAVSVDSGWAGDATGDDITTIENIRGSAFGDYLYGDAGANILRGDAGGDVLYGAGNSDTIYYSTSPFSVSVDLSSNSATGGDAQGDVLVSVENVFGTAFGDVLVGDSASNTLVGWLGIDMMAGNGGNDIFRWSALGESGTAAGTRDLVTDFYRAHGDLLDFSGIDANANLAGDQAFAFIGFAAFSATGQLRYTFDGLGSTIIELNAQGSLAADMAVQLTGQTNMAAIDFIL